MTFFADLTPHAYTRTDGLNVLNVGWLDGAEPFSRGRTSAAFREALAVLCERPIHRHRGFHVCDFCPRSVMTKQRVQMGNGQIRVLGPDGLWYAAPTMVHHYVAEHGYRPPAVFIDAVLKPLAVGIGVRAY